MGDVSGNFSPLVHSLILESFVRSLLRDELLKVVEDNGALIVGSEKDIFPESFCLLTYNSESPLIKFQTMW